MLIFHVKLLKKQTTHTYSCTLKKKKKLHWLCFFLFWRKQKIKRSNIVLFCFVFINICSSSITLQMYFAMKFYLPQFCKSGYHNTESSSDTLCFYSSACFISLSFPNYVQIKWWKPWMDLRTHLFNSLQLAHTVHLSIPPAH